MYKVSYIPGGAGFLASTVVRLQGAHPKTSLPMKGLRKTDPKKTGSSQLGG